MVAIVSGIHHITVIFAFPGCFSMLVAGSHLHVIALHEIAPMSIAPNQWKP